MLSTTLPLLNQIPVSIITGFLGSGKTTFLNSLLPRPEFSRTVVIVNEFGEIGLDHLLIARPAENIVLLEGGCLCCEVRGDLVQTLLDLYSRRHDGSIAAFDQVLIETTGLSNPVPIIQSILCDGVLIDFYAMGKVITLVDAAALATQVNEFSEVVQQIAVADLLLISKADVAEPQSLAGIKTLIREINPGSPIEFVMHGVAESVDCNALFSPDPDRDRVAFLSWIERGETILLERPERLSQHLGHKQGLRSIHAGKPSLLSNIADVHSFSLRREGEISSENVVMWLNLLATMKGKNLLRLKAILNVDGKPVAIHATQTIVHEPIQLNQWPSVDRSSRFVVISRGVIRKEFELSLVHLNRREDQKHEASLINPSAYQQFLKLAEAFSPVK